MQLERLDHFAQRHHGLATIAAAAHLGISRSTWYRGIASAQFEQLYPNVARLWGSPDTFHQRALAAVWATGGDAMASHRTSAALWGIERPTADPLDVLLPSRVRHALPHGVVIHRPRDLLDLRPIMRHMVPTTNPMRMLLDLGAVDPGAVADAMIQVMTAKVASPAAIRSALYRHARQGRTGITALRVALQEWLDDELPPDSELERVMARVLRQYRLPPVTFHARAAGFEVDFLVTGSTIVIECDGWGSHGLNRNQFEFDRLRDADLTAAGYTVVHVTWAQLRDDPAAAALRLRRVIQRWAPQLLATTNATEPVPEMETNQPQIQK
ncbi:MAG: type IV toxin-antitoxin system AbiEi family antitoxin domain-containing protein [Actinomycetota bacterium]|nr:type IV toxin-antitoxin system AbiEi family antitoxin domain-containing protein [Actinomycetota bacterium]